MSDGASSDWSVEVTHRDRVGLLLLAGLVLVAGLVPPVGVLARRYIFVGAIQFGLFATVVPALVVLGAPWGMGRGASAGSPGRTSGWGVARLGTMASSWADARLRHRGPARMFGFVALDAALVGAWRVPVSVNALVHIPALSLLEAASLGVGGVLLWLELVASPPFAPRASFPTRMGAAAAAMWVSWIVAYLLGLSHSEWFTAYHHSAGGGLSLNADQQLAAGCLWLVAGLGYAPVIFASLIVWLKDSEDVDDELRQIVRAERRRASWVTPAPRAPRRPKSS